ncbi:hypothetical protein S83_035750, partial [Arachis hypogaea]
TIKVKDSNNRKARVIYDAKEVINGLQAPIVKDAENLAESIDNAGLHDLFQKFGNILSSFGNCFGASNWFRRSDDSDTAEKPRERGATIIHQFCHLGSFSFLGGGSMFGIREQRLTFAKISPSSSYSHKEVEHVMILAANEFIELFCELVVSRLNHFKAKDKYKVYNLCSERLYDASLFEGKHLDLFFKPTAAFIYNVKFPLQVASFPFDNHNCPPLQLIISFCHSAYSWLKLDIENVVVVHCKARMARTGLMIFGLLLFLKIVFNFLGYTETLDQKSDIAVPEDDHGLNAIDILDPSIFTKCIYLTEVYHFCDIIDMLLGCGYKKGTTLLGYGSDFKQSNT